MPPQDQTKPNIDLPPPSADPSLAEKYVGLITNLINEDKLEINRSDLKKFDLTCMEDHYRINLKTYDIEVSHSKHPDTGSDIFILIFNNISKIDPNNQGARVILSYAHLTAPQFITFKHAADNQLSRRHREEEEKRFKDAMQPVDEILDKISQEKNSPESQESRPDIPLPKPMELPPVPDENPQPPVSI